MSSSKGDARRWIQYIDGFMQDCGICIVDVLEVPQFLRASYGVSFVSILKKNDRVIKGLYCIKISWPFVSISKPEVSAPISCWVTSDPAESPILPGQNMCTCASENNPEVSKEK